MIDELKGDIKKLKSSHLIIIFLLPLLLFLFLRWNSFSMPFERDEGEYAYSAWIMSKGISPYTYSFMQKPPMIIYTYLLARILSTNALWPARILMFIFLTLSVYLLAYLVYKNHGGKEAVLSIYLGFVMLTFPPIYPFAANTENFLLLFFIAFYATYTFGKNKRNQGSYWLWGGIFAAISFFYKPIILPMIVLILIIWLVKYMKLVGEKKGAFINVFLFILGGLIISFLCLSYFWIKGSMGQLWEYAFLFNAYYSAQWGLSPRYFLMNMEPFLKYWWFLFIPTLVFVFKDFKSKFEYLGLILVGLATVYVSPIAHYYLLLMPFWTLIISISLVYVWNELVKKRKSEDASGFVVFTALIIFIMLYPFRMQLGKTPEELNLWEYGSSQPFYEAKIVADHVTRLSKSDDYIFVAGSEPEVYYYSQRLSPTRFVIVSPLSMKTAKRSDYQKLAIKELDTTPPKLIVWVAKEATGLRVYDNATMFTDYLSGLVKKKYILRGGFVMGYQGYGIWMDNLNSDDIQKASYLVYEKI